MKTVHILLKLLSIIIIVSSCKHQNYLEQALVVAGDNRTELEAVLKYYSEEQKSTLKYNAAVFLIENMPGHYSYKDTALLNRYYNAVDTALINNKGLSTSENIELLESVSKRFSDEKLQYIQDIHIIKASYLINDIDRSFDIWENSEWATHVKFEDFCEYILPYKVTELQPLDDWKEYMMNIHRGNIDTLKFCSLFENSAYLACLDVNQLLKDTLKPNIIPEGRMNALPIVNPKTLLEMPIGRCDDYSVIALLVMRSKGIPVIIDDTPQWPFRSMGHSWNTVLHNTGKNVVFAGANTNPGEPHKVDHKMAKIYRKTYAINRDILSLISEEKQVPKHFRNYFKKDVTEEYMDTEDLEIKLNVKNPGCKYAYLAVFNDKEWIPVQYGKISGNKVKFEKIGRDIVYLPVYYKENMIIPASEPFLLTERGDVKILSADTLNTQTLVVNRKYPFFQRVYNVGKRVIGGKIQASNQPDFKNCVTLHTIKDFGILSGEIHLESVKEQYRYWRYYSPDSAYCNMADLFFYPSDANRPVIEKIIGTNGSYIKGTSHIKEAVFDNNPLSYFDAPIPSGAWVGMDFGKAVSMSKILYVPRGDGNCVTLDHKYELLYWQNNKWVSTGHKVAEDIKLIYENLPSNTLYWLRDLTEGVEERIFTYENGKQVWW